MSWSGIEEHEGWLYCLESRNRGGLNRPNGNYIKLYRGQKE